MHAEEVNAAIRIAVSISLCSGLLFTVLYIIVIATVLDIGHAEDWHYSMEDQRRKETEWLKKRRGISGAVSVMDGSA